ncbi:RNA helicase [Oleiphilus sp. HI0072]|nr:RNA helicase [Oleiphilus sp. HI0072]
MSFESLGLSLPLLKAIEELGYKTPSPIQEKAIPEVLAGHDLLAAAQTGTGKTAGFTLPILDRLVKGEKPKGNRVRAVILAPTRELAAQIAVSVEQYSKHLPLRSSVVYGGVKINPQMMLLRKGLDILVATPGRLLDLHSQNAVKFEDLEILVLDEADRMLDMGFIRDIRKIISLLPKNRQSLLFSATFSDEIKMLSREFTHNPVEVSVSPSNTTAKTIEQWIYPVDKNRKSKLLCQLIKEENWQQTLVFCRTKHGSNRLTRVLEGAGIKAAAIHGNKSQGARTRALQEFKSGVIQVLVATDIAARGIDIDQLPQVVNFELPHVSEDYVHRIGRTGRAGSDGLAISLVCADEFKELKGIERLTKQVIQRRTVEGFEPVHSLPESQLDTRPIKAKKPKKPKKPKAEQHGNQAKTDSDKNKHRRAKRRPTQKQSRGNQSSSQSSNKDIWKQK